MKDHLNDIAATVPEFAYSIFCGVIHCDQKNLVKEVLNNNFVEWQSHAFKDNSANTGYDEKGIQTTLSCINDLKKIYYPGFIHCLFPAAENYNKLSPGIRSYTKPLETTYQIEDISIPVKYLDLFLFPENILIYCFKCDLTGFSIDQIIKLNYTIRETEPEKADFLFPILNKLSCDGNLNLGNKLKLFTVVEDDFSYKKDYSPENLLFDLATCSPVSCGTGEGDMPSFKPSESYFKETLARHRISVFDNWSALSLFDSFALLHKGKVYNYNWEFVYFRLLFIHSLFVKNYLVEISKKFLLDRRKKNLEHEFHEFNKHFNLKQISHNFLPQLIYEKIRTGFNIENELTEIRHSIERDHRIQEEKNEKKVSVALFIVAMLTVFTATRDGSEWLVQVVNVERGPIFNIITLTVFISVYLTVFYLLLRKK